MNNKKMQIRGREGQSRETWDSKAESLTPSLAWFLPCFKIQGQLCLWIACDRSVVLKKRGGVSYKSIQVASCYLQPKNFN